eukprot:CAMPEP_0197518474 /NCGR_PEP_ID=MMETSP1318-20131121/3681_1 /TAXON_ID=552666 /ORGANISM="Partenskyella glossopodia, Strain RCC365" /LENGTH=323 /DNA_ID=CAMNT_0043068843 /DNA_START=100 /DNA_END=1071 /DNA_ORIENTATION=-
MSKHYRNDEEIKAQLFPVSKRVNQVDYSAEYNEKNVSNVATTLFNYLDGKSANGLDIKDSELTWGEFALLCKAAGCDVVKTQLLWKQTDLDLSGSLDREEFFRFCARPDVYPTAARMAARVCEENIEQQKRIMASDELFDYLDKNADNMLSWEEFIPLCRGAGCSGEQAREGWSIADTNESGFLDRDEFRNFVTSNTCWPVMCKLYWELQHIKIPKVVPVSDAIFEELKATTTGNEEYFNSSELTFTQFARLCATAGATSAEKAKELFIATDQDGSGSISRKEFAYFCARRDVWPVMQKIYEHLKKKKEEETKDGNKTEENKI